MLKRILLGAFCFGGVLILPLIAAPLTGFEPGCYVLNNRPTTSFSGQLKLLKKRRLQVQGVDGKITEYPADEVTYARIGTERYPTFGSFAEPGKEERVAGPIFVPLLDSGQVMLMRYDYKEWKSGPPPALLQVHGQLQLPNQGRSLLPDNKSTYLLQSPASRQPTALPTDSRRWMGIGFHKALEPYLTSRPDLMQLVYQNRVTQGNLPAIIRAFNTHQPYAAATSTSSSDK